MRLSEINSIRLHNLAPVFRETQTHRYNFHEGGRVVALPTIRLQGVAVRYQLLEVLETG
jgi:hypothetical protein